MHGIADRLGRLAHCVAALACTGVCFFTSPPASAQLDTISPFYMPGRFCAWDNSGPGMWMCSGPPVNDPALRPKPPIWGAIAIAPNFNWWTSTKFESQAKAEKAALDGCATYKAGPCKSLMIIVDGCAALATSPAEHISKAIASGAVNWAEESALGACKKAGGRHCKVATSICADGKRHVQTCQTEFFNGNPVCVEPGAAGRPFGRGG